MPKAFVRISNDECPLISDLKSKVVLSDRIIFFYYVRNDQLIFTYMAQNVEQ